MNVLKPIKEDSLFSRHTRGINVREDPNIIIMIRSEFHRHTKIIMENCSATEKRGLPNHNCATRGTSRRNVIKSIKGGRTDISNKHGVKRLFLCLLEANHIAVTFHYTIPNNIPLLCTIYSSNIPTKHRPGSG
jgi:hypothetical protein